VGIETTGRDILKNSHDFWSFFQFLTRMLGCNEKFLRQLKDNRDVQYSSTKALYRFLTQQKRRMLQQTIYSAGNSSTNSSYRKNIENCLFNRKQKRKQEHKKSALTFVFRCCE
jgi:hypothetical protein